MGARRREEGENEGTGLVGKDTLGRSRKDGVSCGRMWLAEGKVGGARIVLVLLAGTDRCCDSEPAAAFAEPSAGMSG